MQEEKYKPTILLVKYTNKNIIITMCDNYTLADSEEKVDKD